MLLYTCVKKFKKLENNAEIMQPAKPFITINLPLAQNIVTCFLKKYSFKAYTLLIIQLETELAASPKVFGSLLLLINIYVAKSCIMLFRRRSFPNVFSQAICNYTFLKRVS